MSNYAEPGCVEYSGGVCVRTYEAKLYYWGGPVVKEPTIYLIFWGPGWVNTEEGQRWRGALINTLRGMTTQYSFDQAYQSIMHQYGDTKGPISENVTFGGEYVESNPSQPEVDINGIEGDINQAIAVNHWPRTSNSVFLYMNGPNTAYTSTFIAETTEACAFHEHDRWGDNFGFVPDEGNPSFATKCNWGFGIEHEETNAATHEYAEAVTDPYGYDRFARSKPAWTNDEYPASHEIADICVKGGESLNEPLNIWVSDLWGEHDKSCVIRDPPGPGQPSVTTEPASYVEPDEARLNGSVNPDRIDTHYYFEYGTTTGYGSVAPSPPSDAGSGESGVGASAEVTSLRQATKYHYRIVATNSYGTTYGSDEEFTTPGTRPSAVLASNGVEDVYYRGENGAIWQATSSGGIVELGGQAVGSPAAVALSSGEQDVYFRGTNGSIWRWYYEPAAKKWTLSQLGGVTVGEPTVAAERPYEVFFTQAEGCQHCIYELSSSNGGATWTTTALGGNAQGQPTAVATPNGGEQVFWVEAGQAGIVSEWYKTEAAGAWHYTQVGGTSVAEKPSVVRYASGKESVYFRAREGCILCEDQLYWNGSTWSTQWGSGQLAGAPIALPESETAQSSYWRGANGALWLNHGEAANYPFAPVMLGGSAAGDPALIDNPGVRTSLFYVDASSGLSDLYYEVGHPEWQHKQLCAYPCGAQGPQPPKVTSVSPTGGSGTGGTAVTISGEYFTNATSVTFGSTPAKSFTVQSSTSIVATAPEGIGTVDVTVASSSGSSANTSADRFTYTPYSTTMRPAAVLLPNGQEDIYFRGYNGAVWQANNYGAVKELGGTIIGNPAAVALPSGEQDVYFHSNNGAIDRWYYNPGNGTWSLKTIGGPTAGDPTVAPGNPHSVFFRASENCIACIAQTYMQENGEWHDEMIGGDAEGDPTAVATSWGGEEVYWTHATDGVIWEWYSPSPTKKEWNVGAVGGTATAEKPAVDIHADGTLSVYFRAREGCIECIDQLYWNNAKWETEWIGGQSSGAPASADEGDETANVYWRGANKEIWDVYGYPVMPGAQWHFNVVGGHPAGDPTEVHNSTGAVSTSLYFIDQMGGLTDQYDKYGVWQTHQICAYPCSAQAAERPLDEGRPSVSNEAPKQGIPVVANSGAWSGEEPIAYGYQWQRCRWLIDIWACSNISGATSAAYTPTAEDAEHRLRISVTATNPGGSTTVSSAMTAEVPSGAPSNTAVPTLSPTSPVEGKTITATAGTWSNSPTAYSYQWKRCNASGEACENIANMTGSTYIPTGSDLGHTLKITVTASNASGVGQASSTASGVVARGTPLYVTSFGASQLSHPYAGAFDAHGHLWVTDGAANDVLKYSASGTLLGTYGSLGSGNLQFREPVGIAVGKGKVYVADAENKRVEILNENGEYVGQFGSAGTGNGQFKNPAGMAVDSSGNVWVTDYANNTVQEFNESGAFVERFGSFGSGNGQFNGAAGVTLAGGNVYVSDTWNDRVEEFTAAGAYAAQFGTYGSGNGQLITAKGITSDSSGNLYVADSGNNRIEVFSSAGAFKYTLGSEGTGNGQFKSPEGVALDSVGDVFAIDSGNHRVQEWKTIDVPAYATSFGSTQLSHPYGAAIDGHGNLWVTDGPADHVLKYSPSGTLLATYGSPGSGNGQFYNPIGIAVNKATGKVYVADSENNRVEILGEGGEYVGQFGSTGTEYGKFKFVCGVVVDSYGNIWTAEFENDRVQEFNEQGAVIRAFGSYGTGNGQFNGAAGLAFSAGNLYVSDAWNNRVEELNVSGEYVAQFGGYGSAAGQLNDPKGLSVDPTTGNIDVADAGNNRIDAFNPAGAFQYSLGSEGAGNGQLKSPEAVTVDGNGNVFAIDSGNHRVEEWRYGG